MKRIQNISLHTLLAVFCMTLMSFVACTKTTTPLGDPEEKEVIDPKPEPEPKPDPDPLPALDGLTITSVTGSAAHGGTMVIQGVGFGAKATAAPVIWDNFESGSIHNSWTRSTGLSINTTNNRHPYSSYNLFHDFKSGSAGQGYLSGGTNSPIWYVKYWFKLDDNFDWGTSTYNAGNANLSNVKYFRMWSTSGSVQENFAIATHGFSGGKSIAINEYIESPAVSFWPTTMQDMTTGVWHLLEFEYKDSDVNEPNGVVRVWFNGSLKLERTNMITRKVSADYKRPYIVGFYDSWNDDHLDEDFYYMDDVYIDNTWSRVVIGNAPSYGDCSIRETQAPTAWTNTEISVTTNKASFPSGMAYLYVVDAEGVVNEVGYPITLL